MQIKASDQSISPILIFPNPWNNREDKWLGGSTNIHPLDLIVTKDMIMALLESSRRGGELFQRCS